MDHLREVTDPAGNMPQIAAAANQAARDGGRTICAPTSAPPLAAFNRAR
jgi:hypothetical protein